jgi:hypothetical protein
MSMVLVDVESAGAVHEVVLPVMKTVFEVTTVSLSSRTLSQDADCGLETLENRGVQNAGETVSLASTPERHRRRHS